VSGFAVIFREMKEHPLFAGDSERLGAWTWLLLTGCWKATKFRVSGKVVELQRGQLCASRSQLAEAWGWAPSKVERFLVHLENEQMIERETGQGRTIITICNYAIYQDVEAKTGQENGQPSGQASDSHRTTKEQGNQETKDIPSPIGDGRDAPEPLALDLAGAIFRTGLKLLMASGHKEPAARSIIGRWRKTYSDGAVLAVLARCQTAQPAPSSPIEWITKALQAEQQRAAGQVPQTQQQPPERASVREIGLDLAARKRRERVEQEERIAIGAR